MALKKQVQATRERIYNKNTQGNQQRSEHESHQDLAIHLLKQLNTSSTNWNSQDLHELVLHPSPMLRLSLSNQKSPAEWSVDLPFPKLLTLRGLAKLGSPTKWSAARWETASWSHFSERTWSWTCTVSQSHCVGSDTIGSAELTLLCDVRPDRQICRLWSAPHNPRHTKENSS